VVVVGAVGAVMVFDHFGLGDNISPTRPQPLAPNLAWVSFGEGEFPGRNQTHHQHPPNVSRIRKARTSSSIDNGSIIFINGARPTPWIWSTSRRKPFGTLPHRSRFWIMSRIPTQRQRWNTRCHLIRLRKNQQKSLK
jgi:hypothetical protein